jgi:hypothetical protein
METREAPAERHADVVGYAVDRFGSAAFADVLGALIREVDLDRLCDAIDEFGLELVAEQFLKALIEGGRLHGSEAAARVEEDRILGEDRLASPTVHAITVADLADEFTRLDLTAPARSCG